MRRNLSVINAIWQGARGAGGETTNEIYNYSGSTLVSI